MTVIIMGAVYKFNKRAWKNFLSKWIVTGEMPNVNLYAVQITPYACDITDLSIEDVIYLREAICK